MMLDMLTYRFRRLLTNIYSMWNLDRLENKRKHTQSSYRGMARKFSRGSKPAARLDSRSEISKQGLSSLTNHAGYAAS